MQPDSTTSVSFHGFIKDHFDALLLITAARLGFIPRFRRRLNMTEQRALICSGSVFLWTEEESSMKRWTDGYPWSPSRIQHEFLLYREMSGRGRARSRTASRLAHETAEENMRPYDDRRRKGIRALAGSLFNRGELEDLVRLSTSGCARVDDVFNRGGLMKKTFSLSVNNETWHLVSYYTLEDVLASCLPTPKENSFFSGMTISEDVLEHYAISVNRRQYLGTSMQSLLGTSPSPPPVLEPPPEAAETYSSPTTSGSPEEAFTEAWFNISHVNGTATANRDFTTCSLPPPFVDYGSVQYPMYDRFHHVMNDAIRDWQTFQ